MNRTLGAAMALALSAVGVGVVAPTAAQAAPRCFPIYYIGHYTSPYHSIESEADLFCEDDPGGYYPLPAKVEKLNVATGVWTVVATGSGYAFYSCVGTATTTYRTGTGARHKSVTAACG